jgi:hypothetical protein
MINTLTDVKLTRREVLEVIKEKLQKEEEQKRRNITSEKSFEMPSWDKYIAHQLGYLKCLEDLNKFIPDPEPKQ